MSKGLIQARVTEDLKARYVARCKKDGGGEADTLRTLADAYARGAIKVVAGEVVCKAAKGPLTLTGGEPVQWEVGGSIITTEAHTDGPIVAPGEDWDFDEGKLVDLQGGSTEVHEDTAPPSQAVFYAPETVSASDDGLPCPFCKQPITVDDEARTWKCDGLKGCGGKGTLD